MKSGQFKALAVTGKDRFPAVPDVPPAADSGVLPGYDVTTWYGVFAPRGRPAAVVAKLNKTLNESLADEAVKKRMATVGDFGKPLRHIINAYSYGDVWSRTALPAATKSLVMFGMMAAAGHPNELRVHLNGAVKNGCSAEQIQEVLLLLTLYCGIRPRTRRTASPPRCCASTANWRNERRA